MRRSVSIYLLPWQLMMIRLASSKSLLWSSRPPNDMWFFANGKGTSPLQPHFHEIRRLHPNSFIEISNILSLISHYSIFRFLADRVGTFKRVNVELHASKSNKVESKQNICAPFTNFRWSSTTMMLELLKRSLENDRLS